MRPLKKKEKQVVRHSRRCETSRWVQETIVVWSIQSQGACELVSRLENKARARSQKSSWDRHELWQLVTARLSLPEMTACNEQRREGPGIGRESMRRWFLREMLNLNNCDELPSQLQAQRPPGFALDIPYVPWVVLNPQSWTLHPAQVRTPRQNRWGWSITCNR